MEIELVGYSGEDVDQMIDVWNEIVETGIAFPQIEKLDNDTALKFFGEQSFAGIARNKDTKEVFGLYILHPNNIGRCRHIGNASYCVKSTARGLKLGEKLVLHSIKKCKEHGFKILQFNAVVKTNKAALHLYEKLGFTKLGLIPGGFLMKDGTYEDIIPHYIKTE